MSRYTGPRLRVMRALGVELPGLSPKKIEKRPYPPGQHGQARKKVSEYRLRLTEKQKLRMNYGLGEKQMRNMMVEASRLKGSPGQNLLELLESRLDNVLFRAGFARSIPAARQIVNHGHVRIGGRRVDIPSFRVKKGQAIELLPRALENAHVKAAVAAFTMPLPTWLETDHAKGVVRVLGRPDPESALVSVDVQKVVEYYAVAM